MVISLESQNVKVKRSVYLNKKRFFNFKINLNNWRFINLNLQKIRLSLLDIPYVLGLFFFLILFSMGMNIFIFQTHTDLQIENIRLPDHAADVMSRELILDYESKNENELVFTSTLYRGETLSSLSSKYGISKETLLNANNITDIKKFFELKSVIIPKTDGYFYNVQPKDTLSLISNKFGVEVKDIFRINNLKSENLSDIKTLFIPGVNPKDFGWNTNLNKFFIYPVDGYITQRFGYFTNNITGITSLYEGIDFSSPINNNVYASKSGFISRIGYSANYGNYIYIDHSGGYRTLYAHLGSIKTFIHKEVKQGEIIGSVGKSGFTSSAKLFFSILNKDEIVNPEDYLK